MSIADSWTLTLLFTHQGEIQGKRQWRIFCHQITYLSSLELKKRQENQFLCQISIIEVGFNEADIPHWNLIICLITVVLFFLLQAPWSLLKVPIRFCFFRVKGRNFNMHTACSNICSLLLRKSSEWLLGICFR